MLEKCIDVLVWEPGIVLCCTKTRIIDEHGDTTGFYEDNINIGHSRPHERLRQYLFERNKEHIMAQFGVIRRADLNATRLMMSMPFSDVILMAELALRGRFREISGHDFVMRHHPLNSTSLYYSDPHALGVFLDPARQGKRISLGLEKTKEWFKVVGNSTIPFGERLMCYEVIARYVLHKAVPNIGHAATAKSPR